MYVKRHTVVKGDRRYVYLRLVEAYRDGDGQVRHRVLQTLGSEDELKASGQLEQPAASFARLYPPPVGPRRHVGPLLLVRHYLARLDLVELIDAAAPMRGRAMLTHGQVIAALVANRRSPGRGGGNNLLSIHKKSGNAVITAENWRIVIRSCMANVTDWMSSGAEAPKICAPLISPVWASKMTFAIPTGSPMTRAAGQMWRYSTLCTPVTVTRISTLRDGWSAPADA
ncbi:DUF4277 domain-containing protein [Candidatus Mycobacterium methanotrophicum]|uniref:DUF4277 domain-containing protein n=1 Tax=Candidatus Mycobacterium methanotrophicum TaxID=2943498 RepID=A0ABY4QTU0_9MYCO|nr:DUF4277 domain-containing protein [Candidatus Mycobacterium methanotrophicum]UQX13374.1 DUF4277 domain-containing protein [Candidatus Mycobacterium methanotrophicum]